MNNKKILTVIITIFFSISILSGVLLLIYGYSLKRASNEFDGLAKVFQESQVKPHKAQRDEKELPLAEEGLLEEPEVTIDFEALYNQNNHISAWISIPGTGLNYPVMHTPENPEYYLYRNFNKDYSPSGVPFIDGRSSLEQPTDNILIHGHNMKNGSMFAQLLSYQDERFLKDHPSIDFYTESGKEIYDIISVFPAEVYNTKKPSFNYYDFINAIDQSEYERYVADAKSLSLFETGIEAEYGDGLMTLSTCSYHTANGRFVIIAKARNHNKTKY